MIPQTLALTISSPFDVIVSAENVTSFRASDESGSFGILPGHLDLLTVIDSSVVRWRQTEGPWHYCALRGGVVTVSGGDAIRIACREGIVGDDLLTLEAEIERRRAEAEREAAQARIGQARLHARAIRQILRHMAGRAGGSDEMALEELFQ